MLRNLNAERILGTPRVGTPASSVPATGTNGPGYLYPWLQEHSEHAGALVRGRITVQPSAGVLVADEDTGFIYTPAGDGAFSFVFQPYADGVAAGAARAVSLHSGEEEPASAPVAWAGLALPATLGTLAWAYTPPPADAHTFAPVGLALDTTVGAIAWSYLPPASEAAFAPGTVPLQATLGALAWAYVPPIPTTRQYPPAPPGWQPCGHVDYTIAVPPVSPVLPLDMLHLQLRLPVQPGQSHPEDALIIAACNSAQRVAQHDTNRAVGVQTIEAVLDVFPNGPIELPLGPATAIQRVTYAAEVDGVVQEVVLAPDRYLLHVRGTRAQLHPTAGWPAIARVVGAVTVRYAAGDMPEAVRQAILLITGHYYRHRQAVSDRQTHLLMLGVEALFGVDRDWSM